MRRHRLAVVLNVILPGSGLIVLRREWLGFAIALLFGLLTQCAIVGGLLVPSDIPRWVIWGAISLAIGAWGLSQWLLIARRRALNSPELARELEALRVRARAALAQGNEAEARRALLVAMSIDDEDVETIRLWARLMESCGHGGRARRAWKRATTLHRRMEQTDSDEASHHPGPTDFVA